VYAGGFAPFGFPTGCAALLHDHPQPLLFIENILNYVCLKDTLKPEKMPLKQKNFLTNENISIRKLMGNHILRNTNSS
jgi:hypothetical protein